MRLITCNALYGLSLHNGRVDTAAMATELAGLQPDVLALQEVDRRQARSGNSDQVDAILGALSATGAVAGRFLPAIVGTPGDDWVPAHNGDIEDVGLPCFGVGLLTRWSVRRWLVLRLRASPVPAVLVIPGTRRPVVLRDEPRGVLIAVVEAPWGVTTIAAAHLSFVPGWNVVQLRQICRALRHLPAPRVLLGDLNLPGPLPSLATGWRRRASRLATFPSPDPKVQLDHVLLDDPRQVVPPTHARCERLTFSDHRAVIVESTIG